MTGRRRTNPIVERVVMGIDRTRAMDKVLRASLARIAVDFDEQPRQFVCVLAEPIGEVQWFAFRASRWARGEALAAGSFEDMLSADNLDFVIVQRDDGVTTDLSIAHWREGKQVFAVHSDGVRTAVFGHVAKHVPRTGDAESFALAARGWPGPIPWNGFTSKCRRIVLRADGRVPRHFAVATGPGRLPPVTVIRSRAGRKFAALAASADETFSVTGRSPAKPSAATPGVAVRLDVAIGRPSEWPDLSKTHTITGRLRVIDSYEPGGDWGLGVVDLGAVRELKYSGTLSIIGRCEELRAPELERADAIHVAGECAKVTLPKLRSVRAASFAMDGRLTSVELPSLEEVKTRLHLQVGDGPFQILLPKLARGEVIVASRTGEVAAGSVLYAPRLKKITFQPRDLRRSVVASPPAPVAARRSAATALAGLELTITDAAAWPDLSEVETIDGAIRVIGGLDVVDLARVRTATGLLEIRAPCAVIARNLESAGELRIGPACRKVKMDELRELHGGELSLAGALADVCFVKLEMVEGTLRIALPTHRGFSLALPRLARGRLELHVSSRRELARTFLIDVPMLPARSISFFVDNKPRNLPPALADALERSRMHGAQRRKTLGLPPLEGD